jgi:putative endonuclease
MIWFVYLLKCADDSLYCGITNDLNKRIHRHNFCKSGAKYTRSRRPVILIKSFSFSTKSQALKEEYRIKQLTRAQKLQLIK